MNRKNGPNDEPHLRQEPQSISVLADALGLSRDAAVDDIKAALANLTQRRDDLSFPEDLRKNLIVIHKATTPEPGTLDLAEVRPVSHDRWLWTVAKVETAVREARVALSNPPSSSDLSKEPASDLPLNPPLSAKLPEARRDINQRIAEEVQGLRDAIAYLQDNWIVPKTLKSSSDGKTEPIMRPAPDVTRVLTKNAMHWPASRDIFFWAPCLNGRGDKLIFHEDQAYLAALQNHDTAARRAYVGEIIIAQSERSNPKSPKQNDAEEQQKIHRALAEYVGGRFGFTVPEDPAELAKIIFTVRQLRALCTFLKAGEVALPQDDDSRWR